MQHPVQGESVHPRPVITEISLESQPSFFFYFLFFFLLLKRKLFFVSAEKKFDRRENEVRCSYSENVMEVYGRFWRKRDKRTLFKLPSEGKECAGVDKSKKGRKRK